MIVLEDAVTVIVYAHAMAPAEAEVVLYWRFAASILPGERKSSRLD